jgi:hypothetical protein
MHDRIEISKAVLMTALDFSISNQVNLTSTPYFSAKCNSPKPLGDTVSL